MTVKIDLVRLMKYFLKRIWVIILCLLIGAGAMYVKAAYLGRDTYTASATLYVYNANPNVVNYQYVNSSDLNTAIQLLDTYKVVIYSNKVLDVVAERLGGQIPVEYIANSMQVSSVSETGVMRVSSTTVDPKLSMDICNAVADIAPVEIIRVVGAGNVEVIDFASMPEKPNSRNIVRNTMIGGMAGCVLAAGILVLLFLMNHKLIESKELTDNYTLPLMTVIPKQSKGGGKEYYLLNPKSPSQLLDAYAKLRMNLAFAMRDDKRCILVTSSMPNEGKSTVAANLSISMAKDGKRVLLIDADLRKSTQDTIFGFDSSIEGLWDYLEGICGIDDIIQRNVRPGMDVICAGNVSSNPAESLGRPAMQDLLAAMRLTYDFVIIDAPPINVVADPIALLNEKVGVLFVTRAGYTDHREIRKALKTLEYVEVLVYGMMMTCATEAEDNYYSKRYYSRYYKHYEKNRVEADD